MTKKILSVLLTLFLLLSCSNSSVSNAGSLLWKVSGNGLENPSYLFGTHHLVPISILDSIYGIRSAFENTKQTVGELDMSDMAGMQMQIMSQAAMPEGVTYSSLLDHEEEMLLDSMLRDVLGVGLEKLGGMLKPAVLTNLISISLFQRFYPSAASAQSLDQYFQDEAIRLSRPVMGLETAQDQIDLLLNIQTLQRQADMLICMVKHPDLLKEQMDDLQVAYHAQDIDALRELYDKEIPDDPCPNTDAEKNALNGDRNRKWLEKLPAIMKEKSSFIAVGCLHLPGEEGLIEGLRKLGYTVEAVR